MLDFFYKIQYKLFNKTNGFVSFNGETWRACSGGYGKGSLPIGNYILQNLRKLPDTAEFKAFKRTEFPWCVDLVPLFKTDRTNLMIHPDGNVPGTLGCIGIIERDNELYNELEDYFKQASQFNFQVRDL